MTEYWVENYTNKFTSSQNIYEKALSNTAGSVGHDLRYTLPFPRYITRAKGSKIWYVDGSKALCCERVCAQEMQYDTSLKFRLNCTYICTKIKMLLLIMQD